MGPFGDARLLRHIITAYAPRRRYWFTGEAKFGPKGPPFTCLYDDATGELTYFYAGPHSAPEEPLLIPRSSDAPEGDGWLISIVGRRAENRTDLVILDALDIAAGPVSTIRIPFRLHEGFHGTWVGSTVTLGLTAASGRRISRNILQIR